MKITLTESDLEELILKQFSNATEFKWKPHKEVDDQDSNEVVFEAIEVEVTLPMENIISKVKIKPNINLTPEAQKIINKENERRVKLTEATVPVMTKGKRTFSGVI